MEGSGSLGAAELHQRPADQTLEIPVEARLIQRQKDG